MCSYSFILRFFFFLMIRRPPRSTRTDTLFPYTTLFRSHTAAHRARRDALVALSTDAGVTPPTAAAAYEVPFPVTDAVSAAQLAAQIESDTAVTYRAFVEQVDTDHLRKFGIDGLTDAAIRGAGWRSALGARTRAV